MDYGLYLYFVWLVVMILDWFIEPWYCFEMLVWIFGLQGVDFFDQGVCNLGFRFLVFSFSFWMSNCFLFFWVSWDWDSLIHNWSSGWDLTLFVFFFFFFSLLRVEHPPPNHCVWGFSWVKWSFFSRPKIGIYAAKITFCLHFLAVFNGPRN